MFPVTDEEYSKMETFFWSALPGKFVSEKDGTHILSEQLMMSTERWYIYLSSLILTKSDQARSFLIACPEQCFWMESLANFIPKSSVFLECDNKVLGTLISKDVCVDIAENKKCPPNVMFLVDQNLNKSTAKRFIILDSVDILTGYFVRNTGF